MRTTVRRVPQPIVAEHHHRWPACRPSWPRCSAGRSASPSPTSPRSGAAVAAFDGGVSIAQVGAVYLGASIVASAAPTPGGLGAMEAALVAGFTGVGIDPGTAVAAVLAYRLADLLGADPARLAQLPAARPPRPHLNRTDGRAGRPSPPRPRAHRASGAREHPEPGAPDRVEGEVGAGVEPGQRDEARRRRRAAGRQDRGIDGGRARRRARRRPRCGPTRSRARWPSPGGGRRGGTRPAVPGPPAPSPPCPTTTPPGCRPSAASASAPIPGDGVRPADRGERPDQAAGLHRAPDQRPETVGQSVHHLEELGLPRRQLLRPRRPSPSSPSSAALPPTTAATWTGRTRRGPRDAIGLNLWHPPGAPPVLPAQSSSSSHEEGSPSTSRTTPRRSRARRWASASASAARCMNPSMLSHERDHAMRSATSQEVVTPDAQRLDDLDEAVLVVGLELLDPTVQVDEAVLVGGQDLPRRVLVHLVERREEVAERVVARLRVERDVRRDAGQHVVARQQHLVAPVPRSTGGPGECPGVQMALRSQPLTSGRSPSSRRMSGRTGSTNRQHRHGGAGERLDHVCGRPGAAHHRVHARRGARSGRCSGSG